MNTPETFQDIERMLEQMESQKLSQEDERHSEEGISQEPQPRRVYNFYFEVDTFPGQEQAAGERIVEAPDTQTMHDPHATQPLENQQQDDFITETPLTHSPKKRNPLVLMLVIIALAGMLIGSVYALVSYLLTPIATITIIPTVNTITTTASVTIVTGQPTSTQSQQQVLGRLLPSITMSQAQTVATTGTGHQDARAGAGTITFYNALPSVQVVAAGELLTGNDGIQVTTDQDAVIPAAVYPTFGQVSVPAHATITGPASNIKAGDIYGPCSCRLNVSVTSSAFMGGQDARSYPMVREQDIEGTAKTLKTSLEQSVQAALQTQVHQEETLLVPLVCKQTVTPDHQAGEEATQVQVTVSETCSGIVYDTQAFNTLLTQSVNQQASKQLGDGYSLQGEVQTSGIQGSTKNQKSIALQVKATGSYAYQFTGIQQQHLKAMIAGKSQEQATHLLLQTPGVQTVSLTVNNGTTLPTDTGHIHLTFLVMS